MNAIVNAVKEELFEQALRKADAADQELNAAHEVHAQNTMVILLFSIPFTSTIYSRCQYVQVIMVITAIC